MISRRTMFSRAALLGLGATLLGAARAASDATTPADMSNMPGMEPPKALPREQTRPRLHAGDDSERLDPAIHDERRREGIPPHRGAAQA